MRTVPAVAGLFAGLTMLLTPAVSSAGVFLSINIAPPALRVYEQPLCPNDGYLWQPAYWAYGDAGYYWVPGAWVAPPQVGFLWTPGYWGFSNGIYAFNVGYWGPTVGFYGGVNYGFGYGGRGFDGGRWQGSHFSYNTAVSRVNTSVIHNTYVQNVSYGSNHTSFNGGPGGISARPTSQETALARQHQQASTQAPRAQAAAPNTAGRNSAKPTNVASARPQAAPAAMNRPAPQARAAAHETAATPAANRAAPQERQQPARAAATSRPVPQQHQQAARAAAPSRPAAQQRAQSRPSPAQHAAAGKPEGKEERK